MRHSILPLLPPYGDYLEPFAGGASIFFLKGGGGCAQLNDLDGELLNCYVHIRDQPEALIERLWLLNVHPDTHRYIKDVLHPVDDLDRATRYFYLNHTSYAGITNLKTCYWSPRSPKTAAHRGWEKRIRQASARLQGVRLTNQDFEVVIEAVPDDAFVYLDPPYRSTRHYKYYSHSFDSESHQRLAACLRRHSHRVRFLLTYDDCTQIRNLYDWASSTTTVERPNRIDRLDNKVVNGNIPARHSVGRELLIRNYGGPSPNWAILPAKGVHGASNFTSLTNDQWAVIEPLIPPLPRRDDDRGRPWRESREVLDGVLWVLARNVPWHNLPDRYPPFQTCNRRYLRWLHDGTMAVVADVVRGVGGPDLSHVPALSEVTRNFPSD